MSRTARYLVLVQLDGDHVPPRPQELELHVDRVVDLLGRPIHRGRGVRVVAGAGGEVHGWISAPLR
ncbi:MAG TPA: hypothetical protein VEO54_30450 [Thermoanaerobaculia bacterium]|nr:hypothetical protein [Thermoanaerobaculia bacterium]